MTRAKPGEGRPFKRKSDGLSVVVVRDAEGRRKYLYASSPAAAIARRDEYLAGTAMGLNIASTRLTVGRQLAEWLDDRRGRVRSSTWVSYESHVRIHLASLRNIALTRLRAAHVRELVRERQAAGCAPRTIGYSLTVLRMAIRQAIADGLVPRNVAAGVTAPAAVGHEFRILTEDEARGLLAAAPATTCGHLWTVMLGTGMRLGETLALRRIDIDRTAGRLTIAGSLRPRDRRIRPAGTARLAIEPPKTSAGRRTIAVPAFVLAAIEVELAADRPANVQGLVFTTPRGTPLDQRNVARRWTAFLAATSLPVIRMHDLRHTAASLMLAQGASLYDVMKLLGHASITMTANTYGHLVEGRSRELAAGMDRLLGRGIG